jgi:multiple sugar transport system permease protein
MFIGFFVALFLVRMKDILSKWVSRFLTSIFIIPWVVPGISAAVAWRMLYHPIFGPINAILGKNIMWLSNSSLSLFSIVIADVWKCTPFFIFIFFAGMMSVPIEQFEAARTDGASMWQEFRYIMLPSILPLMLVASAFRAIDAFTKIFDLVYVLTGGGPGRATEVLPLLIYKTGLKYFRFGTASTLAVVAILISLVFGMGLLKRQR